MQHNKHTTEKRRHLRIKKNLAIKIKNIDFDIVTETKNISCAGAYCEIDRYLAPLTKIKTRLLIPSNTKQKHMTVDCEGVVVRIERNDHDLEERYSIAIYFENIHKADIAKINRFIQHRSATNYPSYHSVSLL